MTIHEAIEQLKSLLEHCKTMHETLDESGEIWARDCEALGMAIAALRGPTREQVRAIKREWEKVDHLDYGELAFDTLRCGECEYEENIDPEEKHPNFCPNCGSPMTKKGVLILCNRLETLKGETTAD